ncbi:MAG: MFS transporter [Chloroflexi bacterium]|nr:MFS transporter [Chloroflexota bacterium]
MQRRFSGLWRQPDFMRLWAGQTISEFGTWLGALSLLAILNLDATPAQMGTLETLKAAPAIVIGLFAGVWVDRLRRRPLLIAADWGRALMLGSVVLLAFLGGLHMTWLYVVAFLVGGLAVLFDVAYHAYIPALVKRQNLVEANGKLATSASLAEIASPGIGGVLVQVLSAPLTLLLDAISFVVSAIFLGAIRQPEAAPAEAAASAGVWAEIKAGLRFTINQPTLRALMGAMATWRFFGGFYAALYGLYVLRVIGLSPALLGIIVGMGGIGSLLGALAADRLSGRWGLGRAIIGAFLWSSVIGLLVPLAGFTGSPVTAVALLLASQLLGDIGLTIYLINSLSVRQAITPDEKLGRVNATYGFVTGVLGTLGIFVGGLIGQAVGVRGAVVVAAVGGVTAVLWLIFSPVRTMVKLGIGD